MPEKRPQSELGPRPLVIAGSIFLVIFAAALIYPEIRSSLPRPDTATSSPGFMPQTQRIVDRSATTTETNNTEPNTTTDATSTRAFTTVASNLSVPWDIAFLPDGTQLVTERSGTLLRFNAGSSTPISVPAVNATGEGGLLGMALHPDFVQNQLLYLYTTSAQSSGIVNRVVRFQLDTTDNELKNRTVIIGGIPGAAYHDGGRIRFGPDGYLYVTTGDAGNDDLAQSTTTLAGKILRLNPDGSVPAGNPFGNAVYSFGHRNPQGLTWDPNGRLWSTEHGRSGIRSGFDEVNIIQKGGNYGWPVIQGSETQDGKISPKAQSGPNTTWAPASAVYHDGSIFFGGLEGSAVYEAELGGDNVSEVKRHLFNRFGRIRTIKKGPLGYLYITTSNTDGRGDPREGDDKIIRVNPRVFDE